MKLDKLEDGIGKYRTVYIDPPWSYTDNTVRGAAARHYETMSLADLEALPVPNLAHADGAFFWIWATWPKIRDTLPHQLISSWGLRWVGEIVWDKCRIGPGRWLRSKAEVLILAVAGKPERTDAMKSQGNIHAAADPNLEYPLPGVMEVVRTPKHSEKPAEFRDLVAHLSPNPRVELFARTAPIGWDVWGLEAPGNE